MNRNKAIRIIAAVCALILVAALIMSLTDLWGSVSGRYPDGDKYTVGGGRVTGEIRNLDVEWIDGRVTVAYHDEPFVLIEETSKARLSGSTQLRWRLDGDTLRIRYAASGALILRWDLRKELTLTLPRDMAFTNAGLSVTSGKIIIPSLLADSAALRATSGSIDAALSAGSIEAKATSGDIALRALGKPKSIQASVTSGTITLDTDEADIVSAGVTSGGVRITAGRVGALNVHATSGTLYADIGQSDAAVLKGTSADVTVRLKEAVSLDVGITSGKISAFLPADPGFTAHVSVTSGRFDHSLDLIKQGADYICGDGSASVTLHATSGQIRIDPIE